MSDTESTEETVISLLLHDVTDRPETSGFMQPTAFRYKHNTEHFREYLDVVAASGVPVRQLPQTDDCDGDTCVVFTFDDGGQAAGIAADMLEDYGWRGSFFVTTDLIGKQGFMQRSQIRELHERGHLVGSHSCSHPDIFRDLPRHQMSYEWSESRKVLQDLLGDDISSVSIPGGDMNDATVEEAENVGYSHIFTSEQRTKPWRVKRARCYGRLAMLNTTSADTLRRWLLYPELGILPERILRFTKSSVKQMIAPVYSRLMERRRARHKSA